MAAPVWILSVDLQTKTAAFQSGLGDAAKSARGAFSDIKSGAAEMGGHVSTNMFASRHAVMAVSEAFGDTMPRAITALLVHIGPLGAALEAAFPFAAIALGAILLIEHFQKLREEGVKLTEDQGRFETAARNALNALDDKLLQAGIRADELRNNHLGALHKQLELIDHQSMAELVHTFSEIAKASDIVFADIKSHWYTFGIGATGAKHAMDEFQVQYASLLSQGKDAEASDLLKGTRASAEKVLEAQKQIKAANAPTDAMGLKVGTQDKDLAAVNALKAAGVGYTENELKAQQVLVDSLRDQTSAEEKIAALKKLDSGNATTQTGKEMSAVAAEAARQAVEHKQKMAELSLSVEREQTRAVLEITQAGIMERLLADMHLADKERDIQLQANAGLQGALDKGGKDYNNQLKELRAKAEEIEAQHGANIEGLKSKAFESQYRLDVQNAEAAERQMIETTEQGSAARLAAIDRAIQEEQEKGLENTEHFRELLTQRTEAERNYLAEEAKLAAEAGKLDAENIQRMGELALAAERDRQAVIDSAHRMTLQARLAEEVHFADEEFAIKLAALEREEAALDKGGKEYQNKLKAIQDKEKQLVQQHENDITAIKNKAEIERNQKILAAEDQYKDAIASGLTEVLMGHQSFAAMMQTISSQIESQLLQAAIKHVEANLLTKQSDAAKAARAGFNAGMELPFPANLIAAPILGAGAYAAVMAFNEGGVVPGTGRGDTVPAMLEPGEGVIPGGVMDGLQNMARRGEMGGGSHYHAHVSPVYNLQAIDTAGVKNMLEKHSGTLQKHVEGTLRKMNR